MELLKNVLIKQVHGGRDLVFIVDNLPKSLLYTEATKLIIDHTNPQQNLVPEFEIDDRGRKILTGAIEHVLHEGIERSQNGDNAYVFFTDYNEAKSRLAAIDRYIEQNVPQADRVPVRVDYAMQRGVMSSAPKPLSDLPRVVLPGLVSPPASAVQVSGTPSSDFEAPAKRVWTEEQKKAAAERLAKARAAKKEKANS